MCCIFTCCGWMIDLVQRVWTFAMSCCISSAICCVLMSSSLSGIALGYNYSLAEYIDLKETNVSVYLKRGVFDDEISDDMEWRRAGHLPVAGHLKDENLITGEPDGEEPLRSGRRLDDSVFNSGDHNKFEGSLMKLTAKPLDEPITPVTYTPDDDLGKVYKNMPTDSIERMKAIQEVLNKRRYHATSTTSKGARRMNDAVSQTSSESPAPPSTPYVWPEIISGRRFHPHDPHVYSIADTVFNPARTAVPDRYIGGDGYWKVPFLFTSTRSPVVAPSDEIVRIYQPTYPGPITFNWNPIRPSTVKTPKPTDKPESVRVFKMEKIPDAAKSAEEFEKFGQKMAEQDMERARQNIQARMGSGDEDYDIDPKGVPSRKKRRTFSSDSSLTIPSELRKNPGILSTDSKGFPNRYKREIYSSNSVSSFIDKLVKSSGVFRTVTVPNEDNILTTKNFGTKNEHIVSSSSIILSTLVKLSKLSDELRTEIGPKILM